MLLFMVAADSDDVADTYNILLNELRLYNPELLDKDRILVVTKNDLLDDELRADIEKTLPPDVPHTFISAVTGDGLMHLKDMVWEALNREI